MKKNKHSWKLVIIAVIIMISVTTLFLFSRFPAKASAVGNHTILNELRRLESLAQRRNLSPEDITELGKMVQIDPVTVNEFEEFEWLLTNGEYVNSFHSLNFLDQYVSTGYRFACVTHSLEHMKLYIQHKDFDFLKKQLDEINDDMPLWNKKLDERRQAFPTTVKNLESKVPYIIGQLKNGNYSSELLNVIDDVYINSIC